MSHKLIADMLEALEVSSSFMIGVSIYVLSIYFVLSIVLLVAGSVLFVKASSTLAIRLGVPKFVVGAVVMSVATTSPELMVSYTAIQQNQIWIAVGNIFGSYIANIGLVLGLAGLVRPIIVSYTILYRQVPFCVAALTLLVLMSMKTYFFWIDAFMLSLLLIPWIVWVAMQSRNVSSNDRFCDLSYNLWLIVLRFVVGAVLLYFGAKVLVMSAEAMAFNFGISPFVIGLTVVAVSTSLPELCAGIVSAYLGEFELLLGNIVGANILLILFVFPLTVMVSNSPIVLSSVWAEYLFMAILSMCLWMFSTYFDDNCRVSRWESAILLLIFFMYQAFVLM